MKKRRILLAVFLSIAYAFEGTARNDSISVKSTETDPWYLEAFGGVNHSMNENLDETLVHTWGISGQSLGATAKIGVGKEWTPIWGWRGILGYNSNKGRANFYNKDEKIYSFHSVELYGDITYDLTDHLFPRRKHNGFNLKMFAGFGGLQTFGFEKQILSFTDDYSNSPRLNWGARVGFQGGVRVSEDVCIGAEITQSFIDDHFSGVAANYPLDGRQNVMVGLIWLFNHKYKNKVSHIDLDKYNIPDELLNRRVVNPIVVFVEPKAEGVKRRVIEGQAFLDYPVNETIIYADYRKNPSELRKIMESIDVVLRDSTVKISSIGIHGYASPEGPYDNNVRLAKGRAEALRTYLLNLYNFNPSIITQTSTPEDWGGLEKYVASSQLNNKEKILEIIRSTDIPEDKREEQMKAITGADLYADLLGNVYPGLRHSDYTVNYTVRNYTLEEARRIITKRPDLLSLNEMYQVANSYPRDSYKYNEAMSIAARLYPNDEIANLNAANIALRNNNLTDAKHYLENAGNSAQAIHARGVLAALEKDYSKAEQYLKRSYSLGIKESAQVLPDAFK